jgi:hypothetical protein
MVLIVVGRAGAPGIRKESRLATHPGQNLLALMCIKKTTSLATISHQVITLTQASLAPTHSVMYSPSISMSPP